MDAQIRIRGINFGALAISTAMCLTAFVAPAIADDWSEANDTGERLLKDKKYVEAERFLKKARGLAAEDKEKYGHYATSVLNLALVWDKLNKPEMSEKAYREVIPIYEKAYNKDSLEVANAVNGLADLCRERGRLSEAEPLYRRAIAIREVKASGHPDYGDSLAGLADVLRRLGRDADAEAPLKRAISVRKQAHGRNHIKVAKAVEGLAGVYMTLGKYDQAEGLYREALSLREALYGTVSPKLAATLESYSECYMKLGKPEKAETQIKRAVTLREPLEKTEKPQLLQALNSYAEVLKKLNKTADLAKVQQRIKALTPGAKPEATAGKPDAVKKTESGSKKPEPVKKS